MVDNKIFDTGLKISQHAQSMLKGSTCCHAVLLRKDGKNFVGVFNGFSTWGIVEDGKGNQVAKLWEDADDEGGCFKFSENSFKILADFDLA